MQYKKCKCGKCERWDSGEHVHECEGCSECKTTFAGSPGGHAELQPHDFEPYFMGGSNPNPVQKCKRCHHIDRPSKALT